MRDELSKICITKDTKAKIIKLAKKHNLAQITILEYLLNGKINLEELKS